MSAEWKAAMEGWLDSESTYRLRICQIARPDINLVDVVIIPPLQLLL